MKFTLCLIASAFAMVPVPYPGQGTKDSASTLDQNTFNAVDRVTSTLQTLNGGKVVTDAQLQEQQQQREVLQQNTNNAVDRVMGTLNMIKSDSEAQTVKDQLTANTNNAVDRVMGTMAALNAASSVEKKPINATSRNPRFANKTKPYTLDDINSTVKATNSFAIVDHDHDKAVEGADTHGVAHSNLTHHSNSTVGDVSASMTSVKEAVRSAAKQLWHGVMSFWQRLKAMFKPAVNRIASSFMKFRN